MTVTLETLRGWRPGTLAESAERFLSVARLLDGRVALLVQAAERIDQAWDGEAGTSGAAGLRARAAAAQDLAQTHALLSSLLRAASDELGPVVRLAVQAEEDARARGLVLHDDGTVVAPPPVLLPQSATAAQVRAAATRRQVLLDAAEQAEAMATRALARATEIDEDTARGLSAVRVAALDGSTWRGRDGALVAAIVRPALPAPGSDPTEVAAWWAALGTASRDLLAAQHPELLGSLDGLPAAVRDAANRRVLAGTERAAAAELASVLAAIEAVQADPEARAAHGSLDLLVARRDALQQRLDLLRAVRAQLDGHDDRALLLLDTEPPGRVAIAIGDVDTADHVAVLVPGMTALVVPYVGNLMDDASALVGTARSVTAYSETRGSVAVVAWIGYTAPTGADVAGRDKAQRGAEALRSALVGLRSSRAPEDDLHLTVIGHSYGSLVVGLAAREPTGVDDVVLMGSPGVGAHAVGDLAVPDGHVYVAEAADDLVADVAWFGQDPGGPGFGATLLHTAGGDHPLGGSTLPSTGHSEYYGQGSESLWNLVAVVTGDPASVTTGSSPDLGDALRPVLGLAPGIWLKDQLG